MLKDVYDVKTVEDIGGRMSYHRIVLCKLSWQVAEKKEGK